MFHVGIAKELKTISMNTTDQLYIYYVACYSYYVACYSYYVARVLNESEIKRNL